MSAGLRAVTIGDAVPVPPRDPGAAPMLQWVPVEALRIDDAYQRPLMPRNWTAIRKIAAAFSWAKFAPVVCAPIAGGKFALIDGQHRAHAAMLCGFADVPAQVVQMDASTQAGAFAAINGETVAMSLWNIYRADLAAGAAWAVAARDAVEAAGCTLALCNASAVTKKARTIYSIAMVRDAIAEGRGALLTFALAGLARSESGDDPDLWRAPILRPWIGSVALRPWLLEEARVDLAVLLDAAIDLEDLLVRAQRVASGMKRSQRTSVRDLMMLGIGRAIDVAAGRAQPVAAE